MTQPPWEVADIIRKAGNRFIERYAGSLGWAPRSMRSLRSSGHLLQLLPQPSLSEVPDQRTGEVAVRPATGTLAGMLLPRGFQCAACAGAVDLAKQETPLRPIV